jgi:hypothetical protein
MSELRVRAPQKLLERRYAFGKPSVAKKCFRSFLGFTGGLNSSFVESQIVLFSFPKWDVLGGKAPKR